MNLFTRVIKLSLLMTCAISYPALSKEIKTNTAKMQAMDKVTGRVKVIEVPVNGNVDFGTFSILVRDCQTRPPEETPDNFAFVDVLDNDADGTKTNIFRGWMMSSSPSISAIEHPIYDIWLLKCIDTEINEASLLTEEELAERNSITTTQVIPTPSEPVNLLENIEEDNKEKLSDVTNEAIVSDVDIENKIENIKAPLTQKDKIIVKGLVPDEMTPTDVEFHNIEDINNKNVDVNADIHEDSVLIINENIDFNDSTKNAEEEVSNKPANEAEDEDYEDESNELEKINQEENE